MASKKRKRQLAYYRLEKKFYQQLAKICHYQTGDRQRCRRKQRDVSDRFIETFYSENS